jgi:hypothetical protein
MAGDPDILEHGIQPLDAVLNQRGLKNADLVAASTEFLTHKQVNKARRGRRLTINVQLKILNALNKLGGEKKYRREDLFNY